MNRAFFNLPLGRKLILAAITVPAFIFVYWFVEEVWPRTPGDPPDWFFKAAFGGPFGLFVLAPLVSARSLRLWRALLLIGAPTLVWTALDWLNSIFDFDRMILDHNLDASLVSGWLLSSLILGALAAAIAPLQVRFRFWPLVGASGLVAGLGLAIYAEYFFCIFLAPCIRGFEWLVVPVLLIQPIGFCLAAHYGSMRKPA